MSQGNEGNGVTSWIKPKPTLCWLVNIVPGQKFSGKAPDKVIKNHKSDEVIEAYIYGAIFMKRDIVSIAKIIFFSCCELFISQ